MYMSKRNKRVLYRAAVYGKVIGEHSEGTQGSRSKAERIIPGAGENTQKEKCGRLLLGVTDRTEDAAKGYSALKRRNHIKVAEKRKEDISGPITADLKYG